MKKSTDIIILSSLTMLIAAIPFVCNIYYVTPDDPRYIGLVSGAYTGIPVKELVYVGTLLGAFESWLYSILPHLEWYSIIYYLLTLFCYITFTLCTLRANMKKGAKYALLGTITVVQIYLSLTPQFTTLATELSIASIALFLVANGYRRYYVMALLLFFFATQIRLAAAFLPYMIACPVFITYANIGNRLWWSKKSWLVGLIAVACISFFADRLTYSSDEWKSFHTTNDARAYIADNPVAEDYSKEINNPKDKLAFELFYKYRIFDLNILTPQQFQEYQQRLSDKALITIRGNIKPYLQIYWKMGMWMVILLGSWLVYEIVRKRRWWILFIFGVTVVLFIMANLQMMSFSFYKERVMLGTFASLLLVTVYLIYSCTRYANKVFQATCVILMFLYLPLCYRAFQKSQSDHSIITETERMLSQTGTDKVMLTVPTCLTPEAFHTSKSPIYCHSIIQGWMHFYPKVDKRLQHFTAFTDGLPILVEKKSIEQIDMIRQLLDMHYGISTKVITISESDHYILLKLQKK